MFDAFKQINPWSSDIIHGRLYRSPSWNEQLAEVVDAYCDEFRALSIYGVMSQGGPVNVLSAYRDRGCVQKFFNLVDAALAHYIRSVRLNKDRISNVRFLTVAARETRGVFTTPHNHSGAQIVITYYPKVVRSRKEPHPHAGNLVFHPETQMPFRYWAHTDTAFYPINTESGTLVMFPAHLSHSTFPLYCEGSIKRALITNVRFDYGNDMGPGGEGVYVTSKEICNINNERQA